MRSEPGSPKLAESSADVSSAAESPAVESPAVGCAAVDSSGPARLATSRERAPAEQAAAEQAPTEAARRIFGAALPTAVAYAELLAGPGVERGLIGPDEASRIWDRHLLNCGVVAELVPDRGRLADLGSGAGLPGLVLAMLRPQVDVVLVEPMARRTAFLAECVHELGLANVRIERGRAEELAGKIGADVVTARAVARLERLATLAVGLARPGGQILAIKGASASGEVADAGPVLRRLRATEVSILRLGDGVLDQPTTIVRFVTAAAIERKSGRAPR
jgi:16S rRNA (guanine527-N7)-methyltransferase